MVSKDEYRAVADKLAAAERALQHILNLAKQRRENLLDLRQRVERTKNEGRAGAVAQRELARLAVIYQSEYEAHNTICELATSWADPERDDERPAEEVTPPPSNKQDLPALRITFSQLSDIETLVKQALEPKVSYRDDHSGMLEQAYQVRTRHLNELAGLLTDLTELEEPRA